MPVVTDRDLFIRALTLYMNGNAPHHVGSEARIAAEFPQESAALMRQISEMKQAALNLPGLWTEPMLGLHDAIEAVRVYIANEYGFLPADLQSKVVSQAFWALR